jgi:hypothetical protein
MLIAGVAVADSLPAVCGDYTRALEWCRAGRRAAPVESVYAKALRANEVLSLADIEPDDLVESSADDSTRALHSLQMPGFAFGPGVWSGGLLEPRYFLALARACGGPADTCFFATLLATQGEGMMATYVEQLTDESGCVRFGEGDVVRCWAAWEAFRKAYPGRYAAFARDEQLDVEETLLGDSWCCGTRSDVLKELQMFLERFPQGRMAKRVLLRMREVRSRRDHMRYAKGAARGS